MKESFEVNLKKAQEDEAKGVEEYNSLKKAKSEELAAGKTALANKEEELADTDEKLASSRSDLEDTNDALDADTKFMADLKEKCTNMDAAYAARTKVRTEEQEAVSEALNIVTSDEARDLMFFQKASVRRVSKKTNQALRDRVVKALEKAKSPTVSVLAIMAKTDVNGADTHPVYTFLKKHGGAEDIKWNFFTKFVVKCGDTTCDVNRTDGKDVPSTLLQRESEL